MENNTMNTELFNAESAALEPAPDQGEWDAAIEAAAKVADDYTALFCEAAALRVSKLIRTLKKGPTP